MDQNFENHAKFVPLYHRVALPIFGINVLWSIYEAIRYFSVAAVWAVLVAMALLILCLYARLFALAVQDRVIRLEMQLKLKELLLADVKPRVSEFTVDQLIALRFASDAELPELARRVLDEHIGDKKEIKKMIQVWRPDFLRA